MTRLLRPLLAAGFVIASVALALGLLAFGLLASLGLTAAVALAAAGRGPRHLQAAGGPVLEGEWRAAPAESAK
jgi:hypothetical protein